MAARPLDPKVLAEMVVKIEKLRAEGLSMAIIAERFGMSRTRLTQWLKIHRDNQTKQQG
jgi:transcriptional regulator with XRE-family HTH domain